MATHEFVETATWSRSLAVTVHGDCVVMSVDGVKVLRLTADQALELAADLISHANQLRQPSDEELIRDAMAVAQEHPGRAVTVDGTLAGH